MDCGREARRALAVVTLSIVAGGCNFGSDEEPRPEGSPGVEGRAEDPAGEGTLRHCFRNSYGDREGEMDREELIVEIDGDRARGSYDWLPAFKDQRRGTIEGDWRDGVVRADYSFMQEGTRDTVRIEIIVTERQALVSGGPPELGLKASIERVACD